MYCIVLCTCVAGKEMGVLGCVGDHILQDESKEKHGVWEPVDYNLTLCRLRHISLYARVDLNPMPESTLTLCQSRLYPLVRE